MADAIISVVIQKIANLVEEQVRNEVNLVRGVKKEVHKLCVELKTIKHVLEDAESRRFKEKIINYWLSRLEQTSLVMEDVLDEWNYDILKLKMEAPPKQKVCSFIPPSSCLSFKQVDVRRDIAKKILNVKAQLDEILMEKDRYNFLICQPFTDHLSPNSWRDPSTSFTDLAVVHGRDSDKDALVTKIIQPGKQGCIQVVSIVGVGGLGKTTLAQLVYNDSRVQKHFDLRIWVCVSDPFDLSVIAKGIIESVGRGDSSNTNNLETLLQRVRDSISGKRFLLVLDDVWTEEYSKWEHLENYHKCGVHGSKILATTRNQKVAKILGTVDNDIHCPRGLSDEDCWLLLRRIALFGRDDVKFEETGKEISKKCNGLPLAAKTLGSLLRDKTSLEEWKGVLNSEIWETKEVEVELFPHLLLSYNDLSPKLKCCFSYCAVFPKDFYLDVEQLIGQWMALGYLGYDSNDTEGRGRECFNILAMHSLFQDFEKSDMDGKIILCKMHDIVHDFAKFIKKSSKVEATGINKNTTCRACSDPSQVSKANEFRCLFWDHQESPLYICDCLTHLRVLSLRGNGRIPQRIGNLIYLRWLNLSEFTLLCKDLKIIFQLYNLQTLCLIGCNLKEIPKEIENLIQLRRLELTYIEFLKELPKEIGNLVYLRHLKLSRIRHLKELPESISNLQELRSLNLNGCLCRLPEGFSKLTGLRQLCGFEGGSGLNNFSLLKKLNHLSGCLDLTIVLNDDSEGQVVEDAQKAELRNKIEIEQLGLSFEDESNESSRSRVRMDILEALEPHPNLKLLLIDGYKGPTLSVGWIVSPINQLRELRLYDLSHLTSLPSLGKLPCLEKIDIEYMERLEIVGREFLGIGDVHESSSNTNAAAIACSSFPKLKSLQFWNCKKWKEWEDITAEEEESAALSIIPCLTELKIKHCRDLTALPHRLLRKASSLERVNISLSTQLQKRYTDEDASHWKSISLDNPRLHLITN